MTNFVKQSFQWFFDMATDTTTAQFIEIKAGGKDIVERLSPFFAAFKNFKLGSVSIRMVPAATLPVDPTGLSYEAGEATVDPRDLFNPGLVRITNGEDNKINTFTAGSDYSYWTVTEGDYYATMLDPRWFKFRLQNGFKRSATPRFWGIGQISQTMFPGMYTNVFSETIDSQTGAIVDVGSGTVFDTVLSTDGSTGSVTDHVRLGSSDRGLFQTGQKIRMGWLPTQLHEQFTGFDGLNTATVFNTVPEIPLISVVLPKAYKTKFYYRVYVQETVLFKDPVAINPYYDGSDNVHMPLDVFETPSYTRVLSSGLAGNSINIPTNPNDGTTGV